MFEARKDLYTLYHILNVKGAGWRGRRWGAGALPA